jgi:hypothetical protein
MTTSKISENCVILCVLGLTCVSYVTPINSSGIARKHIGVSVGGLKRQIRRLASRRSWVWFPLQTCDTMRKQSVKVLSKIVGFLWILWFPPTENVDRMSWDKFITNPSIVAVLHDQTWIIRWESEQPWVSLRLRLSASFLYLPNSVQLSILG